MNTPFPKQFVTIAIFFLIALTNFSYSCEINKVLCKEFLDATEIYVFDNDRTTEEFTFSEDSTFTFFDLVKSNWPDKKVTLIKKRAFHKLKNARTSFHLNVINYASGSPDRNFGSLDAILIQKGKSNMTSTLKGNVLYTIHFDYLFVKSAVLPESLTFAVHSLKEILDEYGDNSFREQFTYRKEGYERMLETDTLYIFEDHLEENLRNTAAISELYPHQFRLVNATEYFQAIKERRKNVLFVEFLGHGFSQIDIYSAYDERLIISTSTWTRYYFLDNQFFEKVF